MDEPQNYNDVLNKMFGNRESLVKALHFYNGSASVKEIYEHGDIARGSIYNLLDEMEDWGMIERTDQESVGRSSQSKMYEFTDFGYTISEAVVDNDSTSVDDVQDLSEQVKAQRETIQELEAKVEELHEAYNEIDDVLDTVEDFLKDQSA